MCGITAIFAPAGILETHLDQIKTINRIQKHRGPDGNDIKNFSHCILGHTRLSVIDTSSAGLQPLGDSTGRYWIVFNGEIYNYLEIKKYLQLKYTFKSKTDSEVLLYAIIEYGSSVFQHIQGMFSFVFFDSLANTLFVARDAFGIKPLYYLHHDNVFYFASEIKALLALNVISPTINLTSVTDYFIFSRTDVFSDTFINEVHRFPKAHYAQISSTSITFTPWWKADKVSILEKMSITDASSRTHEIFLESLKYHMRSDVKVGSCLSGGLDSSILVGALSSHNLLSQNFETFSAVFPNSPLDESHYIEIFSRNFNIPNHKTTVTINDFESQYDQFSYFNEEPTTGPSFFTQYKVMELAKQNRTTVLLDGQGGDENFAGYQYFHAYYLNELLRAFQLRMFFKYLYSCVHRRQNVIYLPLLLYLQIPAGLKRYLIQKRNHYLNPEVVKSSLDQSHIFNQFLSAKTLNESISRHFQYKLEHLLRSEDRNSMAFSIECRVPYLYLPLVEALLSFPSSLKLNPGETKFLQKKALSRYSLPEIINRRDKIGFGTPFENIESSAFFEDRLKKAISLCQKHFRFIFTETLATTTVHSPNAWKILEFATWAKRVFSL